MAKNGACELCGLPDNSYSIEDNGNVFKVCKLCHDGFIAKHGGDAIDNVEIDIDALAQQIKPSADGGGSKPQTLSPDEMAKLLKPTKEERRKINNAMKRANVVAAAEREAEARAEERRKLSESLKRTTAMLAADTADIRRELLEAKELIEEEERKFAGRDPDVEQNVEETEETTTNGDIAAETEEISEQTDVAESDLAVEDDVPSDKSDNAENITNQNSRQDNEPDKIDAFIKASRAETKRAAAFERMRREVNPTIDDERIKITGPEVELKKDTRPKTNLEVATKEHVGAVRFIEAFKFIVNPVTYAVFAGLIVLAVATAYMIIMTWKEAVIALSSGIGAVAIGFLLVWYLKRRLEVDKRTFLLRMRQEQILFDSIATPCYRELKTKYPMIKALAWLFGKLSVILMVTVIIGGTAAAVILSFLGNWWLLAPVMLGAVLSGVMVYYMFKLVADCIYYKLDIERNQQIMEQSLLDLLAKRK